MIDEQEARVRALEARLDRHDGIIEERDRLEGGTYFAVTLLFDTLDEADEFARADARLACARFAHGVSGAAAVARGGDGGHS